MDLVIMAAGMGSRFGGLKQLESIDNDGNFIIDYSVFDAIKAGFDHVVLIIKEQQLELFKQTVGNRIEKHIKVTYVFQDINNLPIKVDNLKGRTKPLGTGHAIYCAKDFILSDFVIINADDFYGQESFKHAFDFLSSNKMVNEHALIAYKIKNTLSDFGEVKRGLIKSSDGNLVSLTEMVVGQTDGKLEAKNIKTNEPINITDEGLVSMNCLALKHNFLNYIEEVFVEFLNKNKNDMSTCEFFLPDILTYLSSNNIAKVKIVPTNDKWFGLTYREDLNEAKQTIKMLKEKNVYPMHLWQEN